MFPLADTDDKRAAFSCGNDGIRIVFIEYKDHISAGYPFQGNAYSFFEIALVILSYLFNEVQQYFRICFAAERITFVAEFLFELAVILDDTVMDHRQFAAG